MRISPEDQIKFADKIMHMIVDDMISGQMDTEADSFQDLHDSVDANEYMIQAEVPWDFEDIELTNDYVGVQEIVDLRLRAGRPTLVEGLEGGDVCSLDWGVTWYTVATDDNDQGTVEIDGGTLIEAAADSIALVRRMCQLIDLEPGDQFSEDGYTFEHFWEWSNGAVTVGAPGTEPTRRYIEDSHLFWVIRKDPTS
jgi:hypothetical protein